MPELDNSSYQGKNQLTPLEIAIHYTLGDNSKADDMVAGQYKDLYVIKIKLTSPTVFGAFLLFFNYAYSSLTDLYGIISKSYGVDEISPDLDWLAFENKISEQISQEEHDTILLFTITKTIKDEFKYNLAKDIKNLLLANDLSTIAHKIQSHIFEKKGILSARVTITYERISSLDMELLSKSSFKIHSGHQSDGLPQEQDEPNEYEFVPIDDEDIKLYVEKRDILLVLDGELMLSPISGMHITGLVSGDKVRVKITDKKKVAVEIARAFNAYQEGVMLPIIGTIISFRHKPGGGFKIFTEIAEGIFLRIDEKEKNIKIDFVAPSPNRPKELQENIAEYVNKYVEQKEQRRGMNLTPPPATANDRKSYVIIGLILIIIILFLLILSRIF